MQMPSVFHQRRLWIAVCFLALFSFLLSPLAIDARRDRKVGARTEMKNVESNEEVQELGRLAVEEYNRMGVPGEGRQKLHFARVAEAQRQVVSGIKYFLKVVVDDERRYDAVVIVKSWVDYRELVSFNPEV